MTRRRRKHPNVRVNWTTGRTNDEGQTYARLRWQEDGKRMSRSLGYVSQTEADEAASDQEAALRLQVDLERNSSAEPGVTDVLAAYLEDLGHRACPGHQQKELTNGLHLRRHLGRLQASKVTTTHLLRYAAKRRHEGHKREKGTDDRVRSVISTEPDAPLYRRVTVEGELRTLLRALRLARDVGTLDTEIPRAPALKFWPADARPPRRLTEVEVARLLQGARDDSAEFGAMMQVFAWSGRRPVAIWAVTVGDCRRLVDPSTARRDASVYWSRDKAGVGRGWGPMTEPAYEAICSRLAQLGTVDPDRLLWTTPTGLPWNSGRMRKRFHRAVTRAGLVDVQPYDLRKFAASQIYAATANLRVTMQFTGHADPKTLLDRYVFAPRDLAEDIAAQITWTPRPLKLVKDEE